MDNSEVIIGMMLRCEFFLFKENIKFMTNSLFLDNHDANSGTVEVQEEKTEVHILFYYFWNENQNNMWGSHTGFTFTLNVYIYCISQKMHFSAVMNVFMNMILRNAKYNV